MSIPTEIRSVLSSHFGHTSFRPCQEEIITRVLEGKHVLGVLPTGAGKSLCYQLPALLLPRATLVVSPLIALMKDQLDGLPPEVYPRATLINSSIESSELERRLQGIASGQFTLIYAAPERLRQGSFLRLLQHVGLSLLVVDEAHCVSVWGHDFRPDYLFIRHAIDSLEAPGLTNPPPTILALTATATPQMQNEIARQLGRRMETVTASTFRPNLRLDVFQCSNADKKMRRLVAACRGSSGSTIVYANSRDRCEKLAAFLRSCGLSAVHYHAGLEREERQRVQESFMLDRARIIVATVAFGMGVDKPNVRLVVHFSLPQSLESYTQEAGRAGRDGKPSQCVLLYSSGDKANLSRWLRQEELSVSAVRDVYNALRTLIPPAQGDRGGPVSPDQLQGMTLGDRPGADSGLRVAISLLEKCGLAARRPDRGRDMFIELLPPPESARADLEELLAQRRRHAEARLETIVGYAEGSTCRHVTIARHFGHDLQPCRTVCDHCLGTAEKVAPAQDKAAAQPPPSSAQVPDVGLLILKTLAALPFKVGRTGLAKILTGAVDSSIKADRCPAYGSMAGFTLKILLRFMDELLEKQLLVCDPNDEYHLLTLTPAGQKALQSGNPIIPNPVQSVPITPAPVQKSAGPPATGREAPPTPSPMGTTTQPTADDDDRFERLRAWRRIEAQRVQLPPYMVFQDTVLRAIARQNPTTLAEMEYIAGLGPRKIEAYGQEVLDLLGAE